MANAPKQTSTKTYGVGPATVHTNTGDNSSKDGKVSVLNADGSVTNTKGTKVFDPAEDLVEIKTDDKELDVIAEEINE